MGYSGIMEKNMETASKYNMVVYGLYWGYWENGKGNGN